MSYILHDKEVSFTEREQKDEFCEADDWEKEMVKVRGSKWREA